MHHILWDVFVSRRTFFKTKESFEKGFIIFWYVTGLSKPLFQKVQNFFFVLRLILICQKWEYQTNDLIYARFTLFYSPYIIEFEDFFTRIFMWIFRKAKYRIFWRKWRVVAHKSDSHYSSVMSSFYPPSLIRLV